MVPRYPAQLAWTERRLDGLPGLRRIWNTTWVTEGPDGDAALLAVLEAEGAVDGAERWVESWTLGAWRATLRRNRGGTFFQFDEDPSDTKRERAAKSAWAVTHLRDRAGLYGFRGGQWLVSSAAGLDALRAAWAASGGSMGSEIHPWGNP